MNTRYFILAFLSIWTCYAARLGDVEGPSVIAMYVRRLPSDLAMAENNFLEPRYRLIYAGMVIEGVELLLRHTITEVPDAMSPSPERVLTLKHAQERAQAVRDRLTKNKSKL